VKRASSPPPLLPGWKRALLAIPARQRGRSAALQVGIALESRADRSGLAWPSGAQLSEDSSLHLRNVRRGLASLREWGFIQDTGHRRGINGKVIVWQLTQPSTQIALDFEGANGGDRRHHWKQPNGGDQDPLMVARKQPNGGVGRHPEASEEALYTKPAAAQRAAAPDVISTRPPTLPNLTDRDRVLLTRWVKNNEPWAASSLDDLVASCLAWHRDPSNLSTVKTPRRAIYNWIKIARARFRQDDSATNGRSGGTHPRRGRLSLAQAEADVLAGKYLSFAELGGADERTEIDVTPPRRKPPP